MDRKKVPCKWMPIKDGFHLVSGLWWVACITRSEKLPGRFWWKYAGGVKHDGGHGILDSIDDCFTFVEKIVKQDPEFDYTIINPFIDVKLDRLWEAKAYKDQI